MREQFHRLAASLLLASVSVFANAGDIQAAAAVPPPPEVSSRARGLLRHEMQGVDTESGSRLEFWFRRGLPPRSRRPEGGIRVHYTALVPGELLGAIRVSGGWSDARGQHVEPGVYLLRYAVQPLLKGHLGVSEYRDFLLLTGADLDPGRAAISQDDAARLSRTSSGGGHPLVMSLRPVGDAPAVPGPKESENRDRILVARIGGLRLAAVVSGGSPPSNPEGM
ncbi:MAG: hypothetical protein ABI592_01275 [Acidobacteriota bacterium]